MKNTIIITGKQGTGKSTLATLIKSLYIFHDNVGTYEGLPEEGVISILKNPQNEITIITTQVPAEKFDTTGCTVISISEH